MIQKIIPTKPKKVVFSIIGKTTVIHSIRVLLQITMEEYAFLDFLMYWFIEKKRTEKITEKDLYQYTGIRGIPEIKQMISSLKKKQLLEQKEIKTPEGLIIVMYPSDSFLSKFKSSNNFENFWNLKIDGKTAHRGNRAKALMMYNKLIKILGWKDIEKSFLKYKAFVDKTGQTQLHTSTWLNPQWEHYKDELIAAEEKSPKKEQIIHSISDDDW